MQSQIRLIHIYHLIHVIIELSFIHSSIITVLYILLSQWLDKTDGKVVLFKWIVGECYTETAAELHTEVVLIQNELNKFKNTISQFQYK